MYADVRCVDDNDEVQADDRCDTAGGGGGSTDAQSDWLVTVRPSVAMTCSVPCDVPSVCLFSDWTAWSPCARRCDGVSSRFRFMEGRPTQFFF